jgi:hypothetical protein
MPTTPSVRPSLPALLLAAALPLLCACSVESSGEEADQASAPVQPPPAETPATTPAPVADGARTLPAGHSADDGHNHVQPPPSALLPGELPKNGRLEVSQTDHDFGTAVEGEVLTHTFGLKSSGEGPLMIMSAKPTCGCTVGRIEVTDGKGEWQPYTFGDKIPTGTDLRLTATLDTKNKKTVAASKINIFCNDPRGTVTLGLTAKLDSYFNVAPNNIDFGEISVADSASRRIEISAKQPGAFKLELDPRPLPNGFQITLAPVSPDAEGRSERWTVEVDLGPDAQEGNLGVPISLHSDREIDGAKAGPDGSVPRYGVTVMASARVRGLISFEPHYLSFGLVRPGQVVSRTFSVKSYDPGFDFPADLSTRFTGPNDNVPEFKYAEYFSSTVRPSDDGKGVDVELTLNGLPDGSDGSFQGRVFLATGHPDKPEVPVLFSGVCRSGVGAAVPGIQVKKIEGNVEGGR